MGPALTKTNASRRTRAPEAPPTPSAHGRADEKRREIILAAAAEFSQKGYAEATLGDIASRLGIHTAGLYYYFENKDAVVEAVLKYGAQRVLERTRQVLDEAPDGAPVEQLKAMIRTHVVVNGHRDDVGRAYWKIYDQVSPQLRKTVRVEARQLFDMWRTLVNKAAESGEIRSDISPSLFRELLVGAVMWIPEWYRPGGEKTLEEIADAVIALFLGQPPAAPAGSKAKAAR